MSAIIKKPVSTIPPLTGYIGLFVMTALSALAVYLPGGAVFGLTWKGEAFAFLFLAFFSMVFYEIVFVKSYKLPETGLDFSRKFTLVGLVSPSFFTKIFGLIVTFALIGVYYAMADIYRDYWYNPFFETIYDYTWLIGVGLLVYFALIHQLMKQSKDAYWHLGRFVLTLGREGNEAEIRDHLLAAAVKTFFLPLMFCSFMYDWEKVTRFNFREIDSLQAFYLNSYAFLMFIDVVYTVIGYVFSARILNSHIRWTERTFAGWAVCLVCYMPLWQMFGRNYFDYHDSGIQLDLLAMWPPVAIVWGATVLILTLIYMLSTVHFGLRFSNLTYRGVITHGTYRLTKHPAYISKNLTWWLMSMPFLAADWTIAVRNCLALLGVNAIYYMRAKTEERNLSEAPEYRAYMEYMKEKSLFSGSVFRRFLKK